MNEASDGSRKQAADATSPSRRLNVIVPGLLSATGWLLKGLYVGASFNQDDSRPFALCLCRCALPTGIISSGRNNASTEPDDLTLSDNDVALRIDQLGWVKPDAITCWPKVNLVTRAQPCAGDPSTDDGVERPEHRGIHLEVSGYPLIGRQGADARSRASRRYQGRARKDSESPSHHGASVGHTLTATGKTLARLPGTRPLFSARFVEPKGDRAATETGAHVTPVIE
jgi:hypothetical protein